MTHMLYLSSQCKQYWSGGETILRGQTFLWKSCKNPHQCKELMIIPSCVGPNWRGSLCFLIEPIEGLWVDDKIKTQQSGTSSHPPFIQYSAWCHARYLCGTKSSHVLLKSSGRHCCKCYSDECVIFVVLLKHKQKPSGNDWDLCRSFIWQFLATTCSKESHSNKQILSSSEWLMST